MAVGSGVASGAAAVAVGSTGGTVLVGGTEVGVFVLDVSSEEPQPSASRSRTTVTGPSVRHVRRRESSEHLRMAGSFR